MGGFGLVGRLGPDVVAFGRPELFGEIGVEAPTPPAHDGPIAGVSRGGVLLGWLLFEDRPRREAAAALEELRGLGLSRQMLLTGDRATVAHRIAQALGISQVVAEALPDDKMHLVLREIAQGQRPMVVGDGINDSLALKAGAVGVAMGAQGTDVALASAELRADDQRSAPAIDRDAPVPALPPDHPLERRARAGLDDGAGGAGGVRAAGRGGRDRGGAAAQCLDLRRHGQCRPAAPV